MNFQPARDTQRDIHTPSIIPPVIRSGQYRSPQGSDYKVPNPVQSTPSELKGEFHEVNSKDLTPENNKLNVLQTLVSLVKPYLKPPCHSSKEPPSASDNSSNTRSWLAKTVIIGGVSLPLVVHVPCGVMLVGGALGIVKYARHCLDSSPIIFPERLEGMRLEKIPPTAKPFSDRANQKAAAVIFDKLPEFKEVIALKIKQYNDEGLNVDPKDVKLVFMSTPEKDICVVACKEGFYCPCGKNTIALFGVGNMDKLDKGYGAEKFPGEYELLKALRSE